MVALLSARSKAHLLALLRADNKLTAMFSSVADHHDNMVAAA